jgi:hypothetical protein
MTSVIERGWSTKVHKLATGEWSSHLIEAHSTHENYFREIRLTVLHRGLTKTYLDLKMNTNFSPPDFYGILVSNLEVAVHSFSQMDKITVPPRRIWSEGTLAEFDQPNGLYAYDKDETYGLVRLGDLASFPGDYENSFFRLTSLARAQNVSFFDASHMAIEEGFIALQNNIYFPIAVAPAIAAALGTDILNRCLPSASIKRLLEQEVEKSRKQVYS